MSLIVKNLFVLNILKAADDLDLLVKLFVPIGTSLRQSGFNQDSPVLDFNVQYHFTLDQITPLGFEVSKLFNPVLQQLFKSFDKNLLYFLI